MGCVSKSPLRIEKRRVRNAAAAKRSRDRRQIEVLSLQESIKLLRDQNKFLVSTVQGLSHELQSARNAFAHAVRSSAPTHSSHLIKLCPPPTGFCIKYERSPSLPMSPVTSRVSSSLASPAPLVQVPISLARPSIIEEAFNF